MDPDLRQDDESRAALADLAEQAAHLAKADLVTGMVGEFPELQGVMGGYYARAEGLPDAVADAIRDHYKPVGQGDDVPTAPVTVAVSLADKLDTLLQFFQIEEIPSGSRDPFALRRAALSVLRLILQNNLRLSLTWRLRYAYGMWLYWRSDDRDMPVHLKYQYYNKIHGKFAGTVEEFSSIRDEDVILDLGVSASCPERVVGFLIDRLKVQQREAGVHHDLIDAVFALGGEDDLVRLLARVKALQAFVETEEGANLLAGYRRAANILRAEAKKGTAIGTFDGFVGYTPDAAEAKLAEVLDAQLPIAEAAIEAENFEGAMTALSVIRPAIDTFFNDVTVNSDDETKRSTRLALLEKLRAAMHKVADFSRIEG
jgi:glycyl-tRNA synthetase beta chain